MEFGDGPGKGKVEDAAKPKDSEKEKFAKECTNIGAGFGAGGSVLTLSIHAKQENVVKMYLFINGQCIRFMPEDVKTVLPVLFNMDYENNTDWIEGKLDSGPDSYIKAMQD